MGLPSLRNRTLARSPELQGGPWVRQYQASGWVRALSHLAADFPAPGASEDVWHAFIGSSLKLPGTVLAVAAVVALAIPMVMCLCHPRLRSHKGGPPLTHLICACCVTLACLGAAASLTLSANGASFGTATWQLNRAGQDVAMASKQADALNASGIAVVRDLQSIKTGCPPATWEFVGDSVANIVHEVEGYIAEVGDVDRVLAELPHRLAALEATAGVAGRMVSWCLALPWALVLASCAAIAVTVAVVEHSGKRCATRCEKCELPCLGLGCVAPAMFLVSAVAAAELSLSILSSSFCGAADETALRYAKATFGDGSGGFNMTRYYLQGQGDNPALAHLDYAEGRVGVALNWVRRYGRQIDRTCPQWGLETSVVLNLQNVLNSINETEALLAPSNIYAYYQATVHETVCGDNVSGLAYAALLQLTLGLICLPALICTASCVIEGFIEERSLVHGIHNFDPLTQDDCDDGLDGPLD